MQGGVFLLSAGDFSTLRNDSYLNVKCRKRVPQPMGGCAVIMGSIVPFVGMDYGVFSLLFLHKGRDSVLIHQGPFHYFSKKILSALQACGFFLRNSLLHHRQISGDSLEKKRKNGGAALC